MLIDVSIVSSIPEEVEELILGYFENMTQEKIASIKSKDVKSEMVLFSRLKEERYGTELGLCKIIKDR